MIRIAGKQKHTKNRVKDNWTSSTAGDAAVREGRPVRNLPGQEEDRFNPFGSATGPDMTRSLRAAALSAVHVESQRQALLALQARLQGDVIETADTALSGCGIEQSCGSPDTADRASEIVEQDVALGLLGSATGTLEQIEAALQRIDDGTYGHCMQCGVRIPAARLVAIPYATCCVQCAARHERIKS